MKSIAERVIERAIEIQQIPAPTFDESQRAMFVREKFIEEGLTDVTVDEVGNVYGRRGQTSNVKGAALSSSKGRRSTVKPLIVSAHLDTVFPKGTHLEVKRDGEIIYGPGLGDNSLGVAALFGLMWALQERRFDSPALASGASVANAPLSATSGDIWFVANVGEEGLGDLRGMKAVVERFGGDVLAYLVLEGLALGHVYHRAVGVKRYRVTARTKGGHSWSDYGQPSAVHELAKLVVQLTSLDLPKEPRTTMNVGKISGGTSVNVIAAEASMELDLRSEGQESLAELVSAAEKFIRRANRLGVSVEAEVIGQRPAGEMDADHPLIKTAQECLHEMGLDAVLTTGSTDANVPLSKGYPSLVLGISRGGNAHTVQEYIHTAPVEQGIEQLVNFVEGVWRE